MVVFASGRVYICTDPKSVKVRNVRACPQVVAALERGDSPVIVHGAAEVAAKPWPVEVVDSFLSKYDWNIEDRSSDTCLLAIRPSRWLEW